MNTAIASRSPEVRYQLCSYEELDTTIYCPKAAAASVYIAWRQHGDISSQSIAYWPYCGLRTGQARAPLQDRLVVERDPLTDALHHSWPFYVELVVVVVSQVVIGIRPPPLVARVGDGLAVLVGKMVCAFVLASVLRIDLANCQAGSGEHSTIF